MNYLSNTCCLIRSIIFYLIFYVLTAIASILLLWTLLLPTGYVRRIVSMWAAFSLFLLKMICGVSVNVNYDSNSNSIDYYSPRIIVSKHQSAMDILILLSLFNSPAFILKKEVLYFPIIGMYIKRCGMIIIDRAARLQSVRKIKSGAIACIGEKISIAIFPEGRRVSIGEVIECKSGGILAIKDIAPITAVYLNTGVVWGRNSIIKYPGSVNVFLHNLDDHKKTNREDFMHLIKSKINSCTESAM